MWVLGVLGLVLSCWGAGTFLMHVASSCPLAANGSALDFDLALVFNKNPLVCYDPDAWCFVPCDWGLLHPVTTQLAAVLNNGTASVQHAEAQRWACDDLAPQFWAQMVMRWTPPQARITPSKTGNARAPVLLTCPVWRFYRDCGRG
ncbi:class II histocompatibility antigen, M beta 1 chain-like [Balearica regulorum gibbericeps]|uniref:class II histocompatibility antigen, M beta 1 chain-like n=1 Tax=Balearica regulorum gibbericeps TaxID=100784 RepID=UPI003F5D9566